MTQTSAAQVSSSNEAGTPWLLYLGLTVVAWGLFVPDQGLWHDDVQNLFRAFVAPERGEGLFPAIATPTRRLLGLPFIVSLWSGHPVRTLHLLLGLAWLGTGLVALRLARGLWPDLPRAGWLAGALTLAATPDFFTNAPVGVGYLWSILAYLAAVAAGLAWLQAGSRIALGAVPLCLSASLWTSDAALAVWPITPLLWWVAPRPATRRGIGLGLLWYLAPLPYLAVLLGQLAAGGSYLERGLVRMGAGQWITRALELVAHNFNPWRWAMDRPLWFPPAGEVSPLEFRLGVAGLSAGLACWVLLARRSSVATPAVRPRPVGRGLLAALILMAAANVAFTSVQLSGFFCRTHLLSRVFASLALGALFAAAWTRASTAGQRAALRLALGAWLALGLAGGLERQDYFMSYSRAHRQELGSWLQAVPAMTPQTRLLLRVPPHERYLATEAGYLARAWAALLYQDSSVECRVFLWSDARATACVAGPLGFECRGERSPDCQRRDGRDHELLPYDRLVLLHYRPAENRYVLAPSLPAGAEAGGERYRPEAQIIESARTPLARALLETRGGLAAWLWP